MWMSMQYANVLWKVTILTTIEIMKENVIISGFDAFLIYHICSVVIKLLCNV